MALPYGKHAAVIGVLVAWGILAVLRVRSILGFAIGAVLIWIPLSMYLNALLFRHKPPFLKKWEPRKQLHFKSFFEWQHERDKPPTMFDKKGRLTSLTVHFCIYLSSLMGCDYASSEWD